MSKKARIIMGIANAVLFIGTAALAVFAFYQAKTPEIVFNKCIDSVVEVKATTENVGESFGTAVLLTEDGKFITNSHVVSYEEYGEQVQFESVQIRFADCEEYEDCSVEKIDYELDLAVLLLKRESKITPVDVSEKTCTFGERVFAIGNTSNYGLGISEGIISVPLVNVTYEEKSRDVIQADISVSAGNSGGALLNDRGELLGIVTFRTKDNSGKINYGFVYSIPVETVVQFMEETEE